MLPGLAVYKEVRFRLYKGKTVTEASGGPAFKTKGSDLSKVQDNSKDIQAAAASNRANGNVGKPLVYWIASRNFEHL